MLLVVYCAVVFAGLDALFRSHEFQHRYMRWIVIALVLFAAVIGAFARADDGQSVKITRLQFAAHVEDGRRIGDRSQERGINFVVGAKDGYAEFCSAVEFAFGLFGALLERADDFFGIDPADAFDGSHMCR